MMRTLRSILAVIAGILTWGLLSAAGTAVARALVSQAFDADGWTDDVGLLLYFLLLGGVVCSLAAGLVTALLAPGAVMGHVAVLAAVELGIGIAVQAASWQHLPLWYHLPFLAMVVPFHLAGGWIVAARRRVVVLAS